MSYSGGGCSALDKNNELAQNVKKLRDQRNLTQEEFGRLIGVTYTTVNRWENGHTKPSPLARRRIEAIARKKDRSHAGMEDNGA